MQKAALSSTSVTVAAEVDDDLTDDDEEIVNNVWAHYRKRPKMPTLYSYALAKGGNPKSNEGPHTIANVVVRRIYDEFVRRNDRVGLKAHFEKLETVDQIKATLAREDVSEETISSKLARYVTDYQSMHAAVTRDFADGAVSIASLAERTWKLENLSPYATYGWKTALNAKTVSAASSKTKGERLRMRSAKGKISVSKSAKLIDLGGSRSFSDRVKYKVHGEETLTSLFGSRAKARRLAGLVPVEVIKPKARAE